MVMPRGKRALSTGQGSKGSACSWLFEGLLSAVLQPLTSVPMVFPEPSGEQVSVVWAPKTPAWSP